jgi:hypothetical protein
MGNILDKALERLTGLSIQELRDTPLSEMRNRVEERTGKPMSFPSVYPAIGRGNVMRDYIVSHEDVVREFDALFCK